MKWGKIFVRVAFFSIIFLCGANLLNAQTVVRGFVKDASTSQPLAFVSVYFEGGRGVMTGQDGSYSIDTRDLKFKTIAFSYTGYKIVVKKINPGKTQEINVSLHPEGPMDAIVIKVKKRPKYRNKDNPAVELIREVIAHKAQNQITNYDYVQYQQYEKLSLSLENSNTKKLKNTIFLRKYKFLFDNLDSTSVEGKKLLPVYLFEKIEDKYLRKDPKADKSIVLGEKQVNYGSFLDAKGIQSYLNRLYSNINIYENNLTVLNVQFLSPIADGGPTFYRYYIRDTVEVNGIRVVQLFFTPRNPADLIFRGTMYITLDGNFGIQKIDMTVSKNANLNLVKGLNISQEFERAKDGRYHVIKSTQSTEFTLTKKATGGVWGERTVVLRDYEIGKPAPDSIYNAPDVVERLDNAQQPDSFWVANRPPDVLTPQEKNTYSNIDTLRNLRSFKTLTQIFTFAFAGWVGMGDWEMGNTNTFYSFNPVEGFRLKFGGRTSTKLSKTFFLDSYLAYGFKDQKFKYLLGATYSFNHKSVYSYPLNYLKVSYQHETTIPGQELLFVQEDNFFLSFKRGNNNKWLYNKYFKMDYVHEFAHNLSYNITFKNWIQAPAGEIFFQKVNDNAFLQDLNTSELSTNFRWAPHEQFYQGKNYRIPIFNKYPIIQLTYTRGIKDLMGGEYNYDRLHFRVDKRFYLSQLGFVDATLESGYIFGKVPFPLLFIHRANQTYAFQDNSYNLMNFLEFVGDSYASTRWDFYFNGFFLNKIPVLKKLKLREVATLKVLYGGLRDENNPAKNPELLKFPTDTDGQPLTYGLSKEPYIEASVGLANIFKLIRVDLVKRITYLDHPDVAKLGIRALIQFQF